MVKRDCSEEVLEAMRKAEWSEETISFYEKCSSWRLPLGAVLQPLSPIEEVTKPEMSKPRNLREYMRQKDWGKR